ncbi:thiol reductant ABC exporter subunit CydC [Lacisediminihabitans sp.]|uniref:thiol reductant ABC exporter subunit CydC n=1 Tax=Lacisediminihabitans sp. TaxID=2787631 RepID=UPI00374CD377
MPDSRLPDARTLAVLRLAQPRLARFAPGALLGLLSAASSVALLATSAWLITRAAEHPPILFLSAAIVGVRAFALGRAGFRYADRLASHDAAFRQLAAVRVGIYSRLVPLAPDGLGATGRGDLLTRLVNDVDELQNLPLRVVQPLVTAAVTAVLSVIGIFLVLPAAGLALAVALAVGFTVSTAAHSAIAAGAERAIAPLRGALGDRLLEFVNGLDVFIAFGAVAERQAAVDEADVRLRRATLARAAGAGVTAAVLSALAALAAVGGLVVGIPALAQGAITGPALAVIALVPLAVFDVVGTAPLAMAAWRQVRSSAERIAASVPADPPVELPSALAGAPSAKTRRPRPAAPDGTVLELVDVAATWPGAAEPAVHGVSVRLQRGDRLVVRGPSGSGKTTLAHLLVRFLDYSGSFRLGGVEARDLPLETVRATIGLVEQSPYLFDESVRQNLLFARDTASDDELVAALERVGLASWLRERGGLDALVGDAGSLVSGGQAGRIALARALLADFPVIVFDEPTANVEPRLAELLLRDILSIATDEHRTDILISHLPVPDELVSHRLDLDSGRALEVAGTFDPTTRSTPAL